jgi:hypothetical protein
MSWFLAHHQEKALFRALRIEQKASYAAFALAHSNRKKRLLLRVDAVEKGLVIIGLA